MKRLFMISIFLIAVSSYCASLTDIESAFKESYKYEKDGNYFDAIDSMMTVYKENINSYAINLRLGWLYYLNKNYSDSILHYEKAEKIIPDSIEAKLGICLPLLADKKYSKVVEICEMIIKVDKYNYYANIREATALRLQNKYSEARKILNKMLKLYPADSLINAESFLVPK